MRHNDKPSATVRHDPSRQLAVATLSGRFQGPDIVQLGAHMVEHPDWRPGFAEVWDVRDAAVDIGPADARMVLDAERSHRAALAGSRTIVIVTRPAVRQAIQLFAHLMRPFGRRIDAVTSPQAAAETLGLASLSDAPREPR